MSSINIGMTCQRALAWLLLRGIAFHSDAIRYHADDCLQGYDSNNTEVDPSNPAHGHRKGHLLLHSRHLSAIQTWIMARPGSWNTSFHGILAQASSSLFESRFAFDLIIALGVVCLVVVLALMMLGYGGRSSNPAHEEVDDDSDGSVVARGEASNPAVKWLDESQESTLITSTSQQRLISMIAPPWSCASLDHVFKETGLAASWKQVRTDKLADDLTLELCEGKSSFFAQADSQETPLECIIYVMQLALHYVPDNLVLQEFTHGSNKTIFVTDDFRLPKTKLRNNEPIEDCFMRCLTRKLGVSQHIADRFASNAVLLRADEEPTDGSSTADIPKVSTIVRKLTVLVQLRDADPQLREDLGIDDGILSVNTRGMEFRWEHVLEDYGLRRLLRKAPDARKVKPNWKASGMAAVLPWKPSDVRQVFDKHGDGADGLEEDLPLLVQMLRKGQVQLGIEEDTERLVCVECRVYLKLSRGNGDLLVHVGEGSAPATLPYVCKLANETPWIAALRAARAKLGSEVKRVALQLGVQEVQTSFVHEAPKVFPKGKAIPYIVREIVVNAQVS